MLAVAASTGSDAGGHGGCDHAPVSGVETGPLDRAFVGLRELRAQLGAVRTSRGLLPGSGVLSSPVQHVWSLSIQGQVFILWPLIMLACAGVAKAAGVTFRRVATYAFAAIFGLSLLHSVVSTALDPEYAYFEATARWWEFAAGSLVALLVTRPGRGKIADAAGWLGVALIVVCAFGAGPEARFPGWISLLPVVGACLVLGGTGTGNRFNVDDALSWRPLVWIGRHSYGLYLWHWPLLITYMLRSANDSVPVSVGLGIMVLSLLLTLATDRLVRRAMPVRGESLRVTGRRFLTVGLVTVLGLGGATSWLQVRENRQSSVEVTAENFPGAASLFGAPVPGGLRPIPAAGEKDAEWTFPGRGCEDEEWTGPITDRAECFIHEPENATGNEPTIVILGDSHARQFAGQVTGLADDHGWRVITYIMMGCRYSGPTEQREAECNEFNADALQATLDEDPEGVLVVGTESDPNAPVGTGPTEKVTTALASGIDPLTEQGIRVVALRDNPRFDYDMFECVEVFGEDHERCNPPRSVLLEQESPLTEFTASRPEVATVDFSDVYCPQGQCRSVIGNVMVYLDRNHITQKYSRTMLPQIEDRLLQAWDSLGGLNR
nr:acyltransferase family protein [Kocuria atrinae]